jgi:outer membrane autotransporter protein
VNVNVIRTANFEQAARTPNDQAIARALDAAASNPALAPILAQIDNGTAAQADVDFDQLEGALVGNHLVANLAGARAVQSALDRHLAELRDDTVGVVQRAAGVGNWTMSYAAQSVGLSFGGGELPQQVTAAVADVRASATGFASRWDKSIAGEPRAYSAWMQGIGAWQTLRGDSELPGLSQSVGGLIGGIDANPFAAVLPTLKSGMAFAYTRGNLNSGLDQGWTEAYRVALYAMQPLGAAYVEGHVGYSYDNMGTTRSIPFAGLAPAGSTHGNEFSATLAAGYRYWVGHLLLEPAASIAYDYVNRAGYTETGADAIGLTVNDASLDSLRFSVGGRALANLEFAGGVLARPELRARYEYDALNPLPASNVAFAGVPLIPFTITGVQPARNAAVLGAGVTISKGEAISAFADYNADLRSNETVQTALAGVRIRW